MLCVVLNIRLLCHHPCVGADGFFLQFLILGTAEQRNMIVQELLADGEGLRLMLLDSYANYGKSYSACTQLSLVECILCGISNEAMSSTVCVNL